MFPLTRIFPLASAVALAAAALVVILYFRHSIHDHITDHGQRSNMVVAGFVKNAIWPEFGRHITSASDLGGEALQAHPETKRLQMVMEELLKGLPVRKVKIYSREGLTVFSTQGDQIGEDIGGSIGFASAVSGKPATELARRDALSSFGHIVRDVDVISSYVPILGADNTVEAVIEIYDDITKSLRHFKEHQNFVILIFIAIFSLLYLFLFSVVRRAERVVVQQQGQILDAKRELIEKNDKLEQEVVERLNAEQALRDLNEDLELRMEQRTSQLQGAREKLSRKQRLAGLGQLIGTVGHELRNPLAVIRNSVAFIGEAVAEAGLDLSRPLDRTERNVKRCEAIISELLDYTRRRELNLETKEIDAWLPEVLDDHSAALKQEVSVVRDLQAPGVKVELDAERFRRVLINVMDNAYQAMAATDRGSGRDGESRLTITTRSTDARLEITVEDTGAGITPEALPEIFEPLFTTKRDGVGLGLPMVKEITEQHGGGVDIASKPGEGTRVTLWLPLRGAAEQAA